MKIILKEGFDFCEFYYFPELNSAFIVKAVGEGINYAFSYIYENFNELVDTIVTIVDINKDYSYYLDQDFVDSKLLIDDILILYKGKRDKIFKIIYSFSKNLHKKDPFYTKEFLSLVNKIHDNKAYKCDNQILFV